MDASETLGHLLQPSWPSRRSMKRGADGTIGCHVLMTLRMCVYLLSRNLECLHCFPGFVRYCQPSELRSIRRDHKCMRQEHGLRCGTNVNTTDSAGSHASWKGYAIILFFRSIASVSPASETSTERGKDGQEVGVCKPSELASPWGRKSRRSD